MLLIFVKFYTSFNVSQLSKFIHVYKILCFRICWIIFKYVFFTGCIMYSKVSAATNIEKAKFANYENLKFDDILCVVCQSILKVSERRYGHPFYFLIVKIIFSILLIKRDLKIQWKSDRIVKIVCLNPQEPVFLPCDHGFCLTCFELIVKKNDLNCPCCRKRFATWLRKTNSSSTTPGGSSCKPKQLVDQKLWTAIKNQFANQLNVDNDKSLEDDSPGFFTRKLKAGLFFRSKSVPKSNSFTFFLKYTCSFCTHRENCKFFYQQPVFCI